VNRLNREVGDLFTRLRCTPAMRQRLTDKHGSQQSTRERLSNTALIKQSGISNAVRRGVAKDTCSKEGGKMTVPDRDKHSRIHRVPEIANYVVLF
jgi:hypothetical protein